MTTGRINQIAFTRESLKFHLGAGAAEESRTDTESDERGLGPNS